MQKIMMITSLLLILLVAGIVFAQQKPAAPAPIAATAEELTKIEPLIKAEAEAKAKYELARDATLDAAFELMAKRGLNSRRYVPVLDDKGKLAFAERPKN